MKRLVLTLLALIAIALTTVSVSTADEKYKIHGNDIYVSGSNSSLSTDGSRDAFVSGFSSSSSASIVGDLHIAGFDVDVTGNVGQDLYAAGASITVSSTVGQDATVSGFSIRLTNDGSVGGNARMAAGTVTVEAPIAGSLLAAGGEINLNATVNGDVDLTASDISFGPNAKIIGKLNYSTPAAISIPTTVITPDRVRFTAASSVGMIEQVSKTIDESVASPWPTFWSIATAFLVTLAFFIALGALFMTFAPEQVASLSGRIRKQPGKALLLGFLGLATLIGLGPVGLATIVGIPLIPIVILAIIVAWTIGYLLGAYALTLRVSEAFNVMPAGPGGRLLALAAGLVILALLNFIPFAGWIFNLAVVLLGLGAITAALMVRLLPSADARPDATPLSETRQQGNNI